LLQIVAAALVTVGSALVLRAVWLVDLESSVTDTEPGASVQPQEWREAA
jgi:hypothetical protein